jgi:hypothetical protein
MQYCSLSLYIHASPDARRRVNVAPPPGLRIWLIISAGGGPGERW